MSKEKIFADGFRFEKKANAPDYVVGRISVKVDEAIVFLNTHKKNGWVNMSIMTSRSGNNYVELDTFEPKQSAAAVPTAPVSTSFNDDEVPF